MTRPNVRGRLLVRALALTAAGAALGCLKDSPTSTTCSVTNPEIVPASLTVKVGATATVAFSADYSVACQNIATDEGTWTSADAATASVAQSVTNPLIATVGGVRVGGPVNVTFMGGPLGVAKTTAIVRVTVVAAQH